MRNCRFGFLVRVIMKSRLVTREAGQRTFVLVLDPDEEAASAINEFATREGIGAASLTAIGAFKRATTGWFDVASKVYRKNVVPDQCEVLSLVGDIAVGDDGKPAVHVHVVLGMRDGSTRGGHFLDGIVNPTLEVTVVESPAQLRRRSRPEIGLALIDIEASS